MRPRFGSVFVLVVVMVLGLALPASAEKPTDVFTAYGWIVDHSTPEEEAEQSKWLPNGKILGWGWAVVWGTASLGSETYEWLQHAEADVHVDNEWPTWKAVSFQKTTEITLTPLAPNGDPITCTGTARLDAINSLQNGTFHYKCDDGSHLRGNASVDGLTWEVFFNGTVTWPGGE